MRKGQKAWNRYKNAEGASKRKRKVSVERDSQGYPYGRLHLPACYKGKWVRVTVVKPNKTDIKPKSKFQLIKEVRRLSVANHSWKELKQLRIIDLVEIIKLKKRLKGLKGLKKCLVFDERMKEMISKDIKKAIGRFK